MKRSGAARGNGSLGFGVIVLAFGIVLLLHNLGVTDVRDVIRAAALSVRDLWPLLFVAWGVGLILEGLRGRPLAEPPAAPEARS
ncbi:MAG: LiaI-LiaF-like domain-containing protein [Thermoanaerobaculia bacterium]